MILTDNGNARAHVRSAPGSSLSFSHFDHEGNITGHPVAPARWKQRGSGTEGKRHNSQSVCSFGSAGASVDPRLDCRYFSAAGAKVVTHVRDQWVRKTRLPYSTRQPQGGEQGTAGQHPHILHRTCLRSKDGGTPSWEASRLCWWIKLCYHFHTQKFLKYRKVLASSHLWPSHRWTLRQRRSH